MDVLQYTFMQRAFLEAILVGGICAIIGVYVVLNSLSFIGAGISHSTFGGVALGFVLGVDPVLSAIVFSTGVALSIGAISRRTEVKHDTAVGIFFAATMALGVLLISLLKGYYQDIFSYLFGNILAVTTSDIILSAVMACIILVTVFLFYKELLAMSFDAEMASVIGLPVRFLYYLLLTLIALTVVVSVKAVGVVLVSALLVTPAAAAFQWTKQFRRMMILSIIFGVGGSVGGLFISYWLNTPSGATIVLLTTIVFFVSWLFSPRKSKTGALS